MNDSRQQDQRALKRAGQHAAGQVQEWADQRDSYVSADLRNALEHAVQEAAELENLGREEARWLVHFMWQDLQQAGEALSEDGRELGDWLKFDLKLIENELLKTLSDAADNSVAQWQALGLKAPTAQL